MHLSAAAVGACANVSGSYIDAASDTIDPRPPCSSVAYSNPDSVPESATTHFFDSVSFKGAFDRSKRVVLSDSTYT